MHVALPMIAINNVYSLHMMNIRLLMMFAKFRQKMHSNKI